MCRTAQVFFEEPCGSASPSELATCPALASTYAAEIASRSLDTNTCSADLNELEVPLEADTADIYSDAASDGSLGAGDVQPRKQKKSMKENPVVEIDRKVDIEQRKGQRQAPAAAAGSAERIRGRRKKRKHLSDENCKIPEYLFCSMYASFDWYAVLMQASVKSTGSKPEEC